MKLGSAWDYSWEYEPLSSATIELEKGQKKRVSIPYKLNKDNSKLTVIVGGKYKVSVPIE